MPNYGPTTSQLVSRLMRCLEGTGTGWPISRFMPLIEFFPRIGSNGDILYINERVWGMPIHPLGPDDLWALMKRPPFL